MVTFLGVELSKEEELLLYSVVIHLADGTKLSDHEVFHQLLKMAGSEAVLDNVKRILRKKIASLEKGSLDGDSYEKGFWDCAKMIMSELDQD